MANLFAWMGSKKTCLESSWSIPPLRYASIKYFVRRNGFKIHFKASRHFKASAWELFTVFHLPAPLVPQKCIGNVVTYEFLSTCYLTLVKKTLGARWCGSRPWLWWRSQNPTYRVISSAVSKISDHQAFIRVVQCGRWPLSCLDPTRVKVKHHDHDPIVTQPNAKVKSTKVCHDGSLATASHPWWSARCFW